MASSVLQCLLTLACVVLATAHPYTSIKSVLLDHGKVNALPAKCLPSCVDINGNPVTSAHVRDPSSCNQYWICLPDGTLYDQPHVCPKGEIVNIIDMVCEPEVIGSDQCDIPDPDCDPDIPKVCYSKETCPPAEDGIIGYPDEEDCGVYHICHFTTVDIPCESPTPYYNGQECVADPKECCKCQAVCSTTWTTIPDPTDTTCESYYLCQGLESASGCKTSMECTTEGYFPRCTNVCDAGFFICPESSVTEKATVEPQSCMNGQVFDPTGSRCVPPEYCHSVGYIASEEEKFKCPDGEKYDPSTSQCDVSYECNADSTCTSSPLTTSSPLIPPIVTNAS